MPSPARGHATGDDVSKLAQSAFGMIEPARRGPRGAGESRFTPVATSAYTTILDLPFIVIHTISLSEEQMPAAPFRLDLVDLQSAVR